jgi:hypothetical protein
MNNQTQIEIDDSSIPSVADIARQYMEEYPLLTNEWVTLALQHIGRFMQGKTDKLRRGFAIHFTWPTRAIPDLDNSYAMWTVHHKAVIPYLEHKGYNVAILTDAEGATPATLVIRIPM